MAWEDDIQNVEGIFGDVGRVVDIGLGIFGRTKEAFFPSSAPIPEPIAAKPIVLAGIPLTFENPIVIIAVLAIGYFVFVKK